MKPIYKRRLLKLAKHLESGKLGHEKFDFRHVSDSHGPHCGTAGCALGELPVAFREWEWAEHGMPRLRNHHDHDSFYLDTIKFFSINDAERSHLFIPNGQWPKQYGGKRLTNKATPHQVAANIRAFVKRKEAV